MPLFPPIHIGDIIDNWTEGGSYAGTAGVIRALGKMPSLRPYAKLKFSGSTPESPTFIVDDILDPQTDKFMYLRSFQYNMLFGSEQVKVTLFDDAGHVRDVMMSIYNSVHRDKDGTTKLNQDVMFMEFEWGWADFSDTLLGIIPIRRNISSSVHKMMVLNAEVSYEEGGVAYQIVGGDMMTHLQGVLSKKIYPQCDIRAAISQLLTDHGLAPAVFGNSGDESGPAECIREWACHGNDVLQNVKTWIHEAGGRSKRGQAIYVWWDSIKSILHVADLPKTGSFNERLAPDLAGPHQVNYWDQQDSATGGGSIVIRFRPKVSASQQLKSIAQVAYHQGDVRAITETLFSNGEATTTANDVFSKAPKELEAGRGMPLSTPTGERGKPIDDLTKSIGLAENADVVSRGFGANTGAMCCQAEMECIGWPRADKQDLYLTGNLIQLVVMAPFGLNHYGANDDNLTWQSSGIDLTLSGYWFIKNMMHVIDDGGYKLKLDIMRLSGPTEPPLVNPDGNFVGPNGQPVTPGGNGNTANPGGGA